MAPGSGAPRRASTDRASSCRRDRSSSRGGRRQARATQSLRGRRRRRAPPGRPARLLDRWLALEEDHGAKQVVLTSASSKTSLGMTWTHRQREGGPPLIGLTSKQHVAFVKGLALYDEVRAYEDVATLDAETPTVLVDVAGNRALRAKVHAHFGDALRRSIAVGIAHGAPDEAVVVPGAKASLTRRLKPSGHSPGATSAAPRPSWSSCSRRGACGRPEVTSSSTAIRRGFFASASERRRVPGGNFGSPEPTCSEARLRAVGARRGVANRTHRRSTCDARDLAVTTNSCPGR